MDMSNSRFIYLEQTINNLKYKLNLSDKQNSYLNTQLERENQQTIILRKLNQELTSRLKILTLENTELEDSKTKLLLKNDSFNNEIQSLKFEIKSNMNEMEVFEKRIKDLEAEIESKNIGSENYLKELQYQKVLCSF
jgi:chromosome segregation ATPase